MKLAALPAALLLVGCQQAGFQPGELHTDPAATEFYQLQAAAIASFQPKPLVRLVAQPDQPITGLESLEVWMPQSAPRVSQYQRQFHPGWNLAGQVLNVAVPMLGNWAISREHRLSQQTVVAGMSGMAMGGFQALGVSGQQTADVAAMGFGAAETGMGHIAETGQYGMGAITDTAQAGIDGVSSTGQHGMSSLVDSSGQGIDALSDTGQAAIDALGTINIEVITE